METQKKKQWKADSLLLFATACWGSSYLLTSLALREIPPITLSTGRFFLAFLVICALSFKKIRHVSASTLKYSALVGLTLAVTYLSSTYGMLSTGIDNASFLCSLTFVFTPILGFFLKHQIPEKKFYLSVAVTFVGVALLTLNGRFRPRIGDLLCIVCAASYAVDLLITESAVSKPDVDAYQLGVYSLAATGLIQLPFAFFLETPSLPQTAMTWGIVLFLGIVCSGVTLVIQTVQQQYTTASRAGLIITMEPVFASLIAYLAVGETLSARGTVGAALMLGAMLIMEIPFKNPRRNRLEKASFSSGGRK